MKYKSSFFRDFCKTCLLALLSIATLQTGNVWAEQLPTGKEITPTAATGSTFHRLNPDLQSFPGFVVGQAVSTAASPDGKTLLILTSGYNRNNDSAGNQVDSASNEYVFVYDISVNPPQKRQVLQIANSFNGIAWNPSGLEFYVSGGPSDNVHIFGKSGALWTETAVVPLGHASGIGLGFTTPLAAGIGVTQDGSRLVIANFRNESISLVSTATRTKTSELDLRPGKLNAANSGVPGGEYPFWVAIKGNNKAYISSVRDREIVVVDISAAPQLLRRIPVKGQPNKMILNRAQNRLYVATDISDAVTVIDTGSDAVLEQISTTAPSELLPRRKRSSGSNPNSLALSPDERFLFVTNGGTNSLAVIQLGSSGNSEVVGLIPTGWYPNSVSVNATGSMLYVVNGKSNTGTNPENCTDKRAIANFPTQGGAAFGPCSAENQYVWQLTKAGLLAIPTPNAGELGRLTRQVARNNNFRSNEGNVDQDDQGQNRISAFLRTKIKHVIYIVKENRTYDQMLGDLEKGNGDPSVTVFPEAISTNHHQLARQFVTLDNFYDSGEVSGDGWNWSTSARALDSVEKTVPVIYAGRGSFTYDYEGTNRNINVGYPTVAQRQAANPVSPSDPDLFPGTADVSAPDGPSGEAGAGYLWNAARRAGLTVRNYGFFIDLTRYAIPVNIGGIPPTANNPLHGSPLGSTIVSFPTKTALQDITDQFFRGYDNQFPDFWRFKEWEREFDSYVANHNLPNLQFVRFMHDHFGNFGTAVDGVNTFETQMADNDYAVGRLVEKVAHSPYRDSTLIFVVEDDCQDGPDHVDAHRSIGYVVGPYVKQGDVVSAHYTTVNMLRTIEDVLGMEPMGLNDATEEPMNEVFQFAKQPWTYSAIVPSVLRTTSLPLPPPNAAELKRSAQTLAFSKPRHTAQYLEAKTIGMDFSIEDRLDVDRFNRILWAAMKGEKTPYPTQRHGRDLRANRKQLLEKINTQGAKTSSPGPLTID